MMNLYNAMKRMLPVAECVGEVKEVVMAEKWLNSMDRIEITGETNDGRSFEMTLVIKGDGKDA